MCQLLQGKSQISFLRELLELNKGLFGNPNHDLYRIMIFNLILTGFEHSGELSFLESSIGHGPSYIPKIILSGHSFIESL